ncbi:hypothetical protein CRX57_27955 [Pseudomonas putida]|uniref:Uncharacterized protein n=1 Tax=Pseudomonas putida TaxID=303 RepID=A0A2C5WDG6_PSEPU|nr:hypothetical protein CRX57_27955 [Pseudomonas putida]
MIRDIHITAQEPNGGSYFSSMAQKELFFPSGAATRFMRKNVLVRYIWLVMGPQLFSQTTTSFEVNLMSAMQGLVYYR